MRLLALCLVFFGSGAWAEECGLYQVEDYGERIAFTIADFNSAQPQTVNYKITNQDSPVISSMVNGLCYCVEGQVTQDPNYSNDTSYQLLSVERVNSGPSSGCGPGL